MHETKSKRSMHALLTLNLQKINAEKINAL